VLEAFRCFGVAADGKDDTPKFFGAGVIVSLGGQRWNGGNRDERGKAVVSSHGVVTLTVGVDDGFSLPAIRSAVASSSSQVNHGLPRIQWSNQESSAVIFTS